MFCKPLITVEERADAVLQRPLITVEQLPDAVLI
jgi:hypothetical protein